MLPEGFKWCPTCLKIFRYRTSFAWVLIVRGDRPPSCPFLVSVLFSFLPLSCCCCCCCWWCCCCCCCGCCRCFRSRSHVFPRFSIFLACHFVFGVVPLLCVFWKWSQHGVASERKRSEADSAIMKVIVLVIPSPMLFEGCFFVSFSPSSFISRIRYLTASYYTFWIDLHLFVDFNAGLRRFPYLNVFPVHMLRQVSQIAFVVSFF